MVISRRSELSVADQYRGLGVSVGRPARNGWLAILFHEQALHYTGFFVGPVLMVGALLARSHAAATWRTYAQAR
jgi:hypothetical protein